MKKIMDLHRAALCAAIVSTAVPAMPAFAADTGSGWFDQYAAELGQRLRLLYADQQEQVTADNGSASFDRYIAELNQRLYPWAYSVPSRSGTHVASSSLPPSFDTYLRYLAQRLNADSGKSGPVMGLDTGSALLDRYVEELNYRLQNMQQASDSTGF